MKTDQRGSLSKRDVGDVWNMAPIPTQGPANPGTKPDRSLRDLFRATAVRCRGKTVVLGQGEGHLAKVISDRHLEVLEVNISGSKPPGTRPQSPGIPFIQSNIDELAIPEEAFNTVVFAEVLEHVDEDKGSQILSKAWRLLKPGGRLIVSVPNEDCIPHPHHVRQFNRRSLKKLLRSLGRPRLVMDQPFIWLMMYVDSTSGLSGSRWQQ